MGNFARLFLRFIAIGVGFFVACIAAGTTYAFLARLIQPEDFGRYDEVEMTVTLIIGVLGVSSLFARAALVPALVLIFLFEFLRLRDWLSHAVAGALMTLALCAVPFAEGGDIPINMIAVLVTCGIVGASIYWLVTGCRAGRWLPSESPEPPPQG
ncbi:hypothetical protein DFR52_105255 [Hoeflea marina]|uniref:Uncharacterized protein n=1 Tax=Hoeflea marina TaxID=274592 RepID=A0A317PGT7_9HYPH|nr:hypothetical protein [Hoeflea marina]PWV98274.1 hypothetical protein DFR52_105255 [Hoeflea marina]